MKVLLINSDAHFEKNGYFYIHKNTGTFVNNLTKTGLNIGIFHFRMEHSPKVITGYRLDSNKLSIYNVKRSKSKIISHTKALFMLMRLVNKFDFLYLFYPNAFFYSIFIAKILRKPFGLYIRGEQNINSKLSKYFYRNAKFVTSISPEFTKLVIESGGKGFTIKPMIDFDLSDIVEVTGKLDPIFFNFLYIGRVEKDKGIFELIKAVKILKENNVTNFKLNIIGNGEHFNQIVSIILEGGIDDLVELHGVITDKETIRRFYKNSDVFVLPTHHEGFPRVLYEAMLFNVPIVTTFVGTIPYLMKDNFNCIEIIVNNSKSIADKLLYIMSNPDIRSTISKNATYTIIDYLKTYNLSHEQILLNNI